MREQHFRAYEIRGNSYGMSSSKRFALLRDARKFFNECGWMYKKVIRVEWTEERVWFNGMRQK